MKEKGGETKVVLTDVQVGAGLEHGCQNLGNIFDTQDFRITTGVNQRQPTAITSQIKQIRKGFSFFLFYDPCSRL